MYFFSGFFSTKQNATMIIVKKEIFFRNSSVNLNDLGWYFLCYEKSFHTRVKF